jgi:hypothetical protein
VNQTSAAKLHLQLCYKCFKKSQIASNMLQQCYICFKKNTIAPAILQIYNTKLHDKTCQADLHQLQNCTKLELQMLQMASKKLQI